MTQSSPSDSFKKRKASLWEASTPGEGALSIFMLHAYKHVAYDGLKGTRLMFHGPMTLKHNVNKKTKKRKKKRNRMESLLFDLFPDPRDIKWNPRRQLCVCLL